MGRSFDRGGQNRKERERGKRRSYRQAERDREARDAVLQAKRVAAAAAITGNRAPRLTSAAIAGGVRRPLPAAPAAPVAVVQAKRPGFLAQVIGRFFKKSA